MANLILPAKFAIQPQTYAPASSLFGRPLPQFVWNKSFGFLNTIGRKLPATSVVGTASALSGIYGPVQGIKGTGSKVMVWANQTIFCNTSDGAGNGDFTFAAMANPANTATRMGLVSQDGSGGGQAYIIANCDTAYAATAGTVMFQTADPTTSGVSAASQTDGNMHFWVGTRVAGVMSLYRDGVQVASSSLAVRNITTNPGVIGVAIGGLQGFAGYESTANHVFSAMFDYGMTAPEVAAWSRNPWQIFTYPASRFWPADAAGGATFFYNPLSGRGGTKAQPLVVH